MQRLKKFLPASLVLALLITGGAGCTNQAKKNRYLARAARDFQAEQFDRAEIEYLTVLTIPPPSPVALGQLGLLYYLEGKLPQAHAYLQKALESQPDNVELQTKLGLACLSLRAFKEARLQAINVLNRQPANAEALLLLADTSFTTNELSETSRRLDALPESAKAGAGYHLARGTLCLRQRALDNAENEFKQALAAEPRSTQCQLTLGNFYLLGTNTAQAGAAFKTAAELAPLRSAARLRYAALKASNGAVDEATHDVQEITRKAPDYVPAWAFLAQMALAQQKNDECNQLLNTLLARDPINLDGLLLKGNLFLANGDAAAAITQFEHIIAVYGKIPQVEYRLALAQLQDGETAKATATLNESLAVDPKFADALLLLANLNLRRGNAPSAIASLTRLTREQPQIPQAHLLLANAYLTQKNPDDALAVYQHMAELFPKSPEVPLLLGSVLADQNQKASARQAFEKSLELSPDYLPALEKIVDMDLLEKQYPAATARVQKQIDKNPKAAGPWLLIAKIHLVQALGYVGSDANPVAPLQKQAMLAQTPASQKDLAEAEKALRKAIELDPYLRTSYVLLAQLYVSTQRHQQALDKLAGLARTNDVGALMQIGMIHDELKHFDAARDAYEKLLKINPRFPPALNNLAYLYSERLGQLDKGYHLAQKARELWPYDPSTADTLGWILHRRGEFTRALALLTESAANLPADPEVQFHLGMTHYMLGEEEPARLCFQRALEPAKDFPGKDQARRCLERLAFDPKTARPTALADLEKQLHDSPDDPILLDRIGILQERAGAFAKAANTCEAALKSNNQNVHLILRLARLYSEHLHDSSKALALARQAHTLAPDSPQATHVLGRLVFDSGDYKWASILLTESARQKPDDPQISYDLAWSYYSLGRIDDAATAMRTAAVAPAQAEDARRFLALVDAAHGPAAAGAALANCEQVLSHDPNYVPALAVMAMVQEQQANYQQAAQLYERILNRFPFFAPATRNLALLYSAHLGNDTKAYDLALKARESFPSDPELAKMLGVLTYKRGDYPRSVQLLNESVRQRPNDSELLYYLGMAHYHLNERPQSKDALQRALAMNLRTPFADEASRLLKQLQ